LYKTVILPVTLYGKMDHKEIGYAAVQ